MIKINLSPVRTEQATAASLAGAVLTLNGKAYDLSELPDGATAQHPVLGEVARNGNDYELTLTTPCPSERWHAVNDTLEQRASHAQRFPAPIIMTTDGEVPLPQPETRKIIVEVPNDLVE